MARVLAYFVSFGSDQGKSAAVAINLGRSYVQSPTVTYDLSTPLQLGPNAGKCASPLGDNLGAGALNDGDKFFLFLVGDLQFVQGRFYVADGRVKFRVADMHGGVSGFHGFAIVLGGTTGSEGEELDQVLLEGGHV